MSLAVSEIFGPTLQGEGPRVGQAAAFLRLAGCNLDCVWCDTPYTWDWDRYNIHKEVKQLAVHKAWDRVRPHLPRTGKQPVLVITGGEPMLQKVALVKAFEAEVQRGNLHLQIETNGTQLPFENPRMAEYVVSPKLRNAGTTKSPLFWDALGGYAKNRAAFKFVIRDTGDLREVDDIVGRLQLNPRRVWLMPEGRTAQEVNQRLQGVTKSALFRGYNVSARLHLRLWGGERGY